MIHPPVTFHERAESAVLRQTASPAAKLESLSLADASESREQQTARLMREIADDAAQHLVETWAEWVPSTAPNWVYDVSRLDADVREQTDDEAGDLQQLARAVRYLELRGLLRRPVPGYPSLVTFGAGL